MLEHAAGFQDANIRTSAVRWQYRLQSIDRVVRPRSDMIERTPVVRHEVTRTQLVEQLERIVGAQVSATKARFPPWRIPDRKQRDVEIASAVVNHLADDTIGIRHECGVAGKEARL